MFRPLLKILDKLLLVGALSDEDIERLLIMIHPESWDPSFEKSKSICCNQSFKSKLYFLKKFRANVSVYKFFTCYHSSWKSCLFIVSNIINRVAFLYFSSDNAKRRIKCTNLEHKCKYKLKPS
jgi:hypothetical protein